MYNIWKLVIIKDRLALPGESIFDVINLIRKIIEVRFVVLSDLQGAGVTVLEEMETKAVYINKLLKSICTVTQFDWCDFFLFYDYPKNIHEILSGSYAESISNTITTVRAVDDTYIYVYTPYDDIVKIINENCEIDSITSGQLSDLEFPE